jgi:hypothetical protein
VEGVGEGKRVSLLLDYGAQAFMAGLENGPAVFPPMGSLWGGEG